MLRAKLVSLKERVNKVEEIGIVVEKKEDKKVEKKHKKSKK